MKKTHIPITKKHFLNIMFIKTMYYSVFFFSDNTNVVGTRIINGDFND